VTRESDLPGAEADYLRPHLVAMARAMLVGVVASGALACCSWLVTLGYRPPERGFFLRAIAASASAWTLACRCSMRWCGTPFASSAERRPCSGAWRPRAR
jgi:hypothetical protein